MCDEKTKGCCNNSQGRCRLPKGYSLEDLFKITGKWPTRELTQEELIETYKEHFSFSIRKEPFETVGAMVEKFGEQAYEILEDVSYKIAYEHGKEQRKISKTLINYLTDIFVRPYCYEMEQIENSPKRSVFKVFNCPSATIAMELGLEDVIRHICPKWHQGFADGFGAKFEMPEFILDGDCCLHIWEEKE